MARPMKPPTRAPAMPSSIVTMKPPGSLPGIKSLAMMPTTRPKTIHERIAIDPPPVPSCPRPMQRSIHPYTPELGQWQGSSGIARFFKVLRAFSRVPDWGIGCVGTGTLREQKWNLEELNGTQQNQADPTATRERADRQRRIARASADAGS